MTHWSRSQLSTPLPYYHSCVFVCVYCMCMHECIKGRSCAQTSVACAEPLQQSAAVIASLVIWTPAFSSRRASGEHSGYRLAHFKRDIISVHFHLLLFFPPGRPRDAEDTEIGKWGGLEQCSLLFSMRLSIRHKFSECWIVTSNVSRARGMIN